MLDLQLSIKALGLLAGFLLMGYGFAIAGMGRYAMVSNKYASGISTVGLVVILVATGGFLAGSALSLALEGAGYLLAGFGGTLAFRRIANNQQRFEQA